MAAVVAVNTKVYEATIHGREVDLDLDGHSVKTIDDLPPEVLDELFGYLTFTEKLISRVVCQKWNTQISSNLVKTSYYSLASNDSFQVLLDSHDAGMNWKNLRIPDLSDAGFVLPSKLKNSITALDVHFPKFRSKICEYTRFLSDFSSLTTLKVRLDADPNDKDCRAQTDPQYLVCKEKTMGIYEKLKILSITIPFNNYSALCKLLAKMNACSSLSLDSLSISEVRPTAIARIQDTYDRDRSSECLPLFNTVRKSAKTLKSLALDISSTTIERVLLKRIIRSLSKIDFLKLENVLINQGAIHTKIDAYFSALQEFIKTQAGKGKLKNVILPWCPNAVLCEELVKSLPKDIEFVGNVQNEHITTEFPSQFQNLKSLCIESDLTKDIFSDEQDSIRRLKFDLWKSRTFQPKLSYGYMLSCNLHNLTEIQFVGTGYSLFDSDLQDIIYTLKDQLRVLHIESFKITDSGVLGVEHNDRELRELILTKRIYLPQSSNEDLRLKNRYLLGSMKMLEKLSLIGTSITDVGIILGFKFGKRLKQLTFFSDSVEITDFGLYSLGSNNPGLEAFQGAFKSEKISTVGIRKLKTELYLTESTRKFKVENEKSDECIVYS